MKAKQERLNTLLSEVLSLSKTRGYGISARKLREIHKAVEIYICQKDFAPPIGTLVSTSLGTERFLANVSSYKNCADGCVEVTKKNGDIYVVLIENCKPHPAQ